MTARDLTGEKFGDLTVLSRDKNRGDGQAYWLCQCTCGNIISVSGTRLRHGKTNCGCKVKNKLINQKFGRLTVIAPTEQRAGNGCVIWKCQCDCGNLVFVRTDCLTSGNTQSCGCLKREQDKINLKTPIHDLTNQKIGKLTVIRQDLELSKERNSTYWLCQCECGNQISVRADHLRAQETTSCGCVSQSAGETVIEEILKKNNILYKKQFSFNDLKNIYRLRFDFALFNKNTKELECLIEFDGLQHYKEINYFFVGKLADFQKRDALKNQYCLTHNIPLFRIHYNKLKNLHTIEDILNINNLVKEGK